MSAEFHIDIDAAALIVCCTWISGIESAIQYHHSKGCVLITLLVEWTGKHLLLLTIRERYREKDPLRCFDLYSGAQRNCCIVRSTTVNEPNHVQISAVRTQDTWPTSAWGALANASVSLHTSLPTNAWWENIVLGFPSQVLLCMIHIFRVFVEVSYFMFVNANKICE